MSRSLLLPLLIATLLAGCASTPPPAFTPADLNHPRRQQLLAHYSQWAGTPYRYGGQGRSGVDCSGFIQRVYAQLDGTRLPRTTEQQAGVGTEVARSQLQPADLVFFKTGWKQRHVGIYIGNGEFIHASTSQGVTISHLDNPYWRNAWWMARRP
ncbi:MAG: NlpC/P60 family protein [Pseudomonadota bacterium]|jgi:cell wall-associated NlpC family hydrolase|nr:NlpC/P60 family protein [Pseudomonadota bacterium]